MTPSANVIFSEIVSKAASRAGLNASYLFGDWAYVADTLTLWGATGATAAEKYPCVALLSPYTEDRTAREAALSLEFVFMVNTVRDYTNEEREQTSFEQVLRPLYRAFLLETHECSEFRWQRYVPHTYTENYRYGRLGVVGSDGKPFGDYIDAIELKNVRLTLKDTCCYGSYY